MTGYEMRISDRSSDVCSSYLGVGDDPAGCARRVTRPRVAVGWKRSSFPEPAMRLATTALALAAVLTLGGCFQDSKAEIVRKAENVTTRDELRKALGDPDTLHKAGPLEEWISDASDGVVRFPIRAARVGPVGPPPPPP